MHNNQFVIGDEVFVKYLGLWEKGRYTGFKNGKHQVKVGRSTYSVNSVDVSPNKKPLSEKEKRKKALAKPAKVEQPEYEDF